MQNLQLKQVWNTRKLWPWDIEDIGSKSEGKTTSFANPEAKPQFKLVTNLKACLTPEKRVGKVCV